MKTKIKVTKQDIKNGVSGSETSCPIACAIKRQVKGVTGVKVTSDEIEVTTDRITITKTPPRSVVRFIDNFDNDKPVKPMIVSLI